MTLTNQLLIAIIPALIGVLIGPFIKQWVENSNLFNKTRGKKNFLVKGKWRSSWVDIGGLSKTENYEILIIDKQRGDDFSGFIEMESLPDKKWSFKGNLFKERFLQLYYYPSKDSPDKNFLDYGCYFLEVNGDGSFSGKSIGFEYENNNIQISNHKLIKLK